MFVSWLLLGLVGPHLPVQEHERFRGDPIHYERTAEAGPVERLARRLEAGDVELAFDEAAGYVPALLEALEVPVSSQVLVFSRTSFQADRISPSTPRAVYFGDDVYLGTIPGAPIVEVTSMDPERGPVFYTLAQDAESGPRFVREDSACLQCHSSSRTRNWPGNLVRSVHPDASGMPILRSGTYLVDHGTQFEKRWGGWYVTGTHGDQFHMGNVVAKDGAEVVDRREGANVVDLADRFDTDRYLSPHSDIVALMVLEHQAEMHNRLARASYEVRLALHREAERNRLFDDPPGTRSPSTQRVLESQADKVLRYLLFAEELELNAPIRGTSGFAEDFSASGRRDGKGRSLKDLDLERRLFRHPCSFLVYSPAFDALPAELLEVLYRELWKVLVGDPGSDDYANLSRDDRHAVREILLATKDGLPTAWR